MSMTGKGKWGVAITVAVACSLVAGTARSAVVVRTDFNGRPSHVKNVGGIEKDTANGRGWRSSGGGAAKDPSISKGYLEVDLKAAGLNLDSGTFDFTVKRDNDDDDETLFTLLGENSQDPLIAISIGWNPGDTRPYNSQIWFEGVMTNETAMKTWVPAKPGGMPYWANRVSLPRNIGNGEKFRLTITWGPSPSDNRLYLNGDAINATLSKNYDFAGIVKRSSKLVIGALIAAPVDGGAAGYHNHTTSPIIDFKMLDAPTAANQAPISIDSVSNDSFKGTGFSGKLVAGDRMQVEVTGTPGASAAFDVARLADADRKISMSWKGFGVYLEDKTFFEEGEVDLHEVSGYRVYVSETPFTAITSDMIPVENLKVGEQSYVIENLNPDVPYYVGVYAEMRDGALRPVIAPKVNLPLTATAPGTYTGEFAVAPLDSYPDAVVVGHLYSGDEAVSLADAKKLAIESALTLQLTATPEVLKADEKSAAKVTVTVTDANGKPVAGHKIQFVLATTSQYTGVVGGGAFAEQVGGSITQTFRGETDLFGTVTASYVAGFAAKTAIIVARDMVSNSTGSVAVKTYIQATAQLTLVDPQPSAAADAGYQLDVRAQDAWLTADGKSQTRVTATLTMAGTPVEGHKIVFSVFGVGSVRAVQDTTNRKGEATAIYTAGKKIGIDLVKAEDVVVGISGTVAIELRSDAPAKIAIEIKPDQLPADGRSRAELQVLVTDINDNPNEGTEVEYLVVSGAGRLQEDKNLTDRDGKSTNEYVAGRSAGVVTFELTVRSTLPTPEEMAKAEDLALLPSDTKFF